MNKIIESLKSTSSDKTEEIGELFASRLKPGDVVFLKGDLGSGKTTFVRGLAKGLGVYSRIISPTFVIVREHFAREVRNNIKKIYHLDLYRLTNEGDVAGIDMEDILSEKESVVLIEWPDMSQNLVSKPHWTVTFDLQNDKRTINISYG